MICRECKNCGLCPGKNKLKNELQVQLKNEVSGHLDVDSSLPTNSVGLAFDIGTTTIACSLLLLSTGEELFSFGESNRQIEFGCDVVSRISFAMTDGGLKKIHEVSSMQIASMINRAMLTCQAIFSERRKGRPLLLEILIAGNTAMESFAAGIEVNSIATYPFALASNFGFEKKVSEVFGSSLSAFENVPVYFAPVVHAYVGGDITCAMIASGFLNDDGRIKFLADIGTNCEMCVRDGNGKITCTSTSAGPAFEGFGIECGAPASKGSIVKVSDADGKIECKVLGGGMAESIAGTGLISAVSEFLESKIISADGEILEGEKIHLSEKVYLTQKDIRNFQLAKGSVFCGLKILASQVESIANAELFLAGGFGTKIDAKEAVKVRMIPANLGNEIVAMGNASLAGASMLLLDRNLREKAELLLKKCTVLNLSEEENFQREFISALGF